MAFLQSVKILNIFLFGILFLIGQSCKNPEEITSVEPLSSVVATIAGENITLDELKSNFNRSSNSKEQPDSSALREFLPSYVEYKLKLREGYRQGLNRDPDILSEYNDYASEAAFRFWIDSEIKQKRIKTFKKRFKDELKAFHILKELPENALPEDTLKVYEELMAVRDSLLNGASPEEMNERYSSKRNDRPIGGQLQWVTAGTTIQPFEDALYDLQIGEISLPVRSQFGYHLIILQDRRPRTPQRLVKHIFIRKKDDGSGIEKARRAYEALQNDTTWSDAVQAYSEDSPGIKSRDGKVGWVGFGARYPREFIEAVMSADPDSSYSKPIEVSYGTHIFKIDSVRTFVDEDQKEKFILNRLQNLKRLNPDKEDVYKRIAAESNIQTNVQAFDSLNNVLTFVPHQPELITLVDKELRGKTLLTAFDSTYTVNQFIDWVDQTTDSVNNALTPSEYLKNFRNLIIDRNIVDFTSERFPEFEREAKHFLNGLIVFRVNEQNIWSPKTVDRNELRKYYEANRGNYRRGKTFVYTVISDTSDSVMSDIYSMLSDDVKADELYKHFKDIEISNDSTYRDQSDEYAILDELQTKKFSEPVAVQGRNSIFILNKIIGPRILSFDEAFDRVLSDYQPIREEKFIDRLKDRYNVKLYTENIH